MNATSSLHLQSLRFANREVLRARFAARRALKHLDEVQSLAPIPELRKVAHHAAEKAVRQYRAAVGKRAFEIRSL